MDERPARDDWSNRPHDEPRRRMDTGSIVWGLILLAVGTWFLLEQTLEIDLPSIPWGDLWPLILIALGGWIIAQAAMRRS